ncbi:MAG: transporter substrate-binding domain-containing protein [Hahellaceae bacterium]|nr:transporter substrate-binding domain-containing protein [Hahellaceae bacterium]
MPARIACHLFMSAACLICLLGGGMVSAWAEEPAPSKILRVAVSFSIPPWVVQETDSGIELDILRDAMDGSGYLVKPVYVPFERAFSLFNEGKVDALINARPNSVTQGYYSDIVVYFHNVAISLSYRDFPEELSMSFLQNARIVAFQRARDFLGESFAAMALSNPNYQEVAEQRLQINLLFLRDADFIVMEREIFNYYHQQALSDPDLTEVEHQKLGRPVKLHSLFAPTGYRFVFREEAIRDRFNEGLARLQEREAYPQLKPPAGIVER